MTMLLLIYIVRMCFRLYKTKLDFKKCCLIHYDSSIISFWKMSTIICLAWIFTYIMSRLLMASILLVCAKNAKAIYQYLRVFIKLRDVNYWNIIENMSNGVLFSYSHCNVIENIMFATLCAWIKCSEMRSISAYY